MAQARIYLTSGYDRFIFPITPNSISVKRGASTLSFNIIGLGEHKIPRGIQATGYSWNGTFPGIGMANLGFLNVWADPRETVNTLTNWMNNGTILDLMITEAGIVDRVFIESFTPTYQGAGNINYQINLTAYRALIVSAAPPQPKVTVPKEAAAAQSTTDASSGGKKKVTPKPNKNTGDDKKTALSVLIPTATAVKAVQNAVKTAVTAITLVNKLTKK